MAKRFLNRSEAGRLLATRLAPYANRSDVIVLGLPRGGVPVAFEVAQGLRVPLNICLVRKLGVPGHKELAMGALRSSFPFGVIASGGVRVLNYDIRQLKVFSKPSSIASAGIALGTKLCWAFTVG